jgi:hypothetical protein
MSEKPTLTRRYVRIKVRAQAYRVLANHSHEQYAKFTQPRGLRKRRIVFET